MRQSSMRSLLSNSSSNGANEWSIATQMGQIRVTKEFFQKLHVVEAGSPRLFRVSRQKLLYHWNNKPEVIINSFTLQSQ